MGDPLPPILLFLVSGFHYWVIITYITLTCSLIQVEQTPLAEAILLTNILSYEIKYRAVGKGVRIFLWI